MAVLEDAGISLCCTYGHHPLLELLGVHRPVRYDPPIPAGDYDHAFHTDHPEAPSFLAQYLEKKEPPRLGGKPKETAPAT